MRVIRNLLTNYALARKVEKRCFCKSPSQLRGEEVPSCSIRLKMLSRIQGSTANLENGLVIGKWDRRFRIKSGLGET